jgi:hypothetical protein
MNLCQTAALALAGWYLMVPPVNANHHPDDAAPISAWKILDSFDKADECRGKLSEMKKQKSDADMHCVEIDDYLRKPQRHPSN